jgi:hypothetical protein
MLNLTTGAVGRFRDCYLQRTADGSDLEVHVYTRNGGGNRSDYEDVTRALRKHERYVRDFDDTPDNTYASYVFSIPVTHKPSLLAAVAQKPELVPAPPSERSKAFMETMQTNPQDPEVRRVQEAMRPTMEKLASFTSGCAAMVDVEDGVGVTAVFPQGTGRP